MIVIKGIIKIYKIISLTRDFFFFKFLLPKKSAKRQKYIFSLGSLNQQEFNNFDKPN